jgi:ribosomal protein L40E
MSNSGDPQAGLRAEYVQAVKARRRAITRLLERGVPDCHLAQYLPKIDWQRFTCLRCGAKSKRRGKPCRLKCIYGNGRCRFHGGLSTGPRTPEGKARSAANSGLAVVRAAGAQTETEAKAADYTCEPGSRSAGSGGGSDRRSPAPAPRPPASPQPRHRIRRKGHRNR